MIHRDLKPENIMVDEHDNIKIIDFGISANIGSRRITFAKLTDTMGTPDYISPEQVKGGRGDARSDVYAAGVMLYEMLTGSCSLHRLQPFHHHERPSAQRSGAAARIESRTFAATAGGVVSRPGTEPAQSLRAAREILPTTWNTWTRWAWKNGLSCTTGRSAALRGRGGLLMYVALALIPVIIFGLLLYVARHT